MFVFAKWHNNHAEVLTRSIKLNGIVLYTNIEFSKELVSCLLVKDICYDWQRILLALDPFVKLMKVTDQGTSLSFFGMMKVGDAHSLSFCGMSIPSAMRLSNSSLKVNR